MIVALAIIQEMGVRMGIVSGKGLADLIREKVGIKITFLMMIALLAANMGNILSRIFRDSCNAGIFGVPKFIAFTGSSIICLVIGC